MDEVVWGWERFFLQLRSFIATSSREIDDASEDYTYYILERLQLILRNLDNIQGILAAAPTMGIRFSDAELDSLREVWTYVSQLIDAMGSYFLQWEHHIDDIHTGSGMDAYSVPVAVGRGRGRPRFEISRDQLEYLASLNFTWTEISSILGVSRNTVYRRRQEFGLFHVGEQINDDNLRLLLRDMRRDNPDMGEVMVLGRIRAMGFRVSRARLREGIRDTDPLNVSIRALLGRTARRPYSVPGPNFLWHIGTYVIRESIIVHV